MLVYLKDDLLGQLYVLSHGDRGHISNLLSGPATV